MPLLEPNPLDLLQLRSGQTLRGSLLAMKTDLYTKAVLTVIAFMLVMIGCHQYVAPATAVKADKVEGQFANLQFAIASDRYVFFDSRTGDVWEYFTSSSYLGAPGKLWKKANLAQPGQPLVVTTK